MLTTQNISTKEVAEIIANYRQKSLKLDYSNLPINLKNQQQLWSNYPLDGNKEKDINNCFDQIVLYLTQMGVDSNLLTAFENEGLLRSNIVVNKDEAVLFMRQMLNYVTVLSKISSMEERNYQLTEFPASLNADEYNCLEGTLERLENSLSKLTMAGLLPYEIKLLEVHKEIIEQSRIKFNPFIDKESQVHLSSAIEYILGIEDKTKNFSKVTALKIPAEQRYQALKNYADQVNENLKRSQREDRTKVKLLFSNPFDSSDNRLQSDILNFFNREIIKNYGFEFGFEDILVMDQDFIPNAWNEDQVLKKLDDELYSRNVVNTITQTLPESLFDKRAPKQIADLILSSFPDDQEFGIKSLLIMGHHSGRGSSPMQLIKTIHQIGIKNEQGIDRNYIDLGKKKLLSLKTLDSELPLNQDIESIIGAVKTYVREDQEINLSNALSVNESGQEFKLFSLIKTNASFQDILECYQKNAVSTDQIISTLLLPYFDKIFDNPGYQKILDQFFSLEDSSQQFLDAKKTILEKLFYYGVKIHNPEMINYVINSNIDDKAQFLKDCLFVCADQEEKSVKSLINWGVKVLSSVIAEIAKSDLTILEKKLNEEGQTILNLLTKKGYKEELVTLLEFFGENVGEVINQNGLLILASANGDQSIIELLIEKGADINFVYHEDDKKFSALTIACFTGSTESAKLLIEKGANINLVVEGLTPLMIAEKNGHKDIVDIIVNNPSLNIDLQQEDGFTALMFSSINKKNDTFTPLIEADSNTLIIDNNFRDAFLHSAKSGNIEVLKNLYETQLLQEVLELEWSDEDGNTALMLAAKNGHKDIVEFLIEKGCAIFPDEDEVENFNCYHSYGCYDAFSSSYYNYNGYVALSLAAKNGHLEVVHVLIDALKNKNLDVDVKNQDGSTALMMATKNGQVEVVRVLIDEGADLSIRDENNNTALSLAEQNLNSAINPLFKARYQEIIEIINSRIIPSTDVRVLNSIKLSSDRDIINSI